MVAGKADGIPLRFQDGVGGFLVDSVEECAEKTLGLLRHSEEGQTLGARGEELVRERFFLTRSIADELRLYGALIGARQVRTAVAKVGLTGEERDPVCGMRLDPRRALEYKYRGHPYHFCSESCSERFMTTPEYFLRATAYRS